MKEEENMYSRKNLFIEIKESTEILKEENSFKELLCTKNILFENILVLSFLEDEGTEEYVGYLYDKESEKIYEYIYNPNIKKLLLTYVDYKLTDNNCRTISIIQDYLKLSTKEIESL